MTNLQVIEDDGLRRELLYATIKHRMTQWHPMDDPKLHDLLLTVMNSFTRDRINQQVFPAHFYAPPSEQIVDS